MENEKQSSISSNFPISKNAMKRQLKNEKIEATRGEWKARMREKIKLKKAAKRDTNLQPSNEKIIEKLPRVIQEEPSGEIIIDLSYESLMTKKASFLLYLM